jgi:putative phosphoesterase
LDIESIGTARVAIVSDTHGCLCPEVLDVVERCDMAVHAGDIGSGKVLDLLHSGTGKVHAVRGNNDVPGLWAGHELDVVNALPWITELQLPGGRLAVEHGHVHGHISPDHGKLRAAHPDTRMVVYGHTHKQVIDQAESPWVVNPGAAGRTRTNGGPSCLVLTASPEEWNLEAFQFPKDTGNWWES